MKYNDKGAEVRKLQEAILRNGGSLPAFGADGHLGDETWMALQAFAEANQLRWNPQVPNEVAEALLACKSVPPDPYPEIQLIDIRHEIGEKQSKSFVRNGKTVMRDWKSINGITLHQTAVRYGITKKMLNEAGRDPVLAQARRVQSSSAHGMALDERWGSLDDEEYKMSSFVALLRPLQSYTYHGNRFNGTDIGLEFEGNFRGVEDDPSTAWRGTTYSGPPSSSLIKAARKLCWVAVTEAWENGAPLRFVNAHRQSSGTRRNDPGEVLWREVGLWCVDYLGLVSRPDLVLHSNSSGMGRPIPVEWDPDNGVDHY